MKKLLIALATMVFLASCASKVIIKDCEKIPSVGGSDYCTGYLVK